MFIDLCVKGVTYHNELQVLIQIMFHWEKKIVSQVVGWRTCSIENVSS